jgi:uncharacterized LabA/DUF88 family protein
MLGSRQFLYVPPIGRMMVFVDGENLTFRYEAMLKAGREVRSEVRHREGIYVWNDNDFLEKFQHFIIRTAYYTAACGSEDFLDEIRSEKTGFHLGAHPRNPLSPPSFATVHSGVLPVVFKKKRNQSSKGVDIRITLDNLSNCYMNNFDSMYLISGDADFIPVIEDVMRRGKKVHVAALSSGASPKLRMAGDSFHLLDDFFF